MTAAEAQNLREIAQRDAAELRETTMSEITELKQTAVRETQQLRAATQREADDLREHARRNAEEMLERAEARTWDLARSAEALSRERRRLIDDMRGVGEQLVAISEAECKRFAQVAEELALGDGHAREQTSTTVKATAAVPHEATKTE